jgi:endonuclease YncB( thermonuclease family)
MRSTVAGILVAGDCSGIGGSAIALEQGRLAGLAAAVDLGRLTPADAHGRAAPVRRRLRALERFRAALTRLYPVGSGVHELWTRDTIVCRCEEVTAGEILDAVAQGHTDPNAVKALTRAGMGHCQGRNCARQVVGLVAGVTGRNPLSDGKSLSQEMVRAGYAWWFRRYSADSRLANLEAQARAAHTGLWADPNPVPPWEWRRARRDRSSRRGRGDAR